MTDLTIRYADPEKTAVMFEENGAIVVVPLDTQGWMRRFLDEFLASGGVFQDYVPSESE